MTLRHITSILTIAALAMTSLTAAAQRRLPDSHSQQHNLLLANQAPTTNPFKIEDNSALFSDLKAHEDAHDPEIFEQFWASESVNPYGANAVIPERKDIDVSDFYCPTPGYVTSNYGYRSRFGRMHYGIDLKLQVGDTVRAAFPGKVRLTKYEGRGYGYYVVIRHPNGMETVYGHLSRFLVKPNQEVKAGEPIALGGNTGRSTGAHLHFETRYMGIPINPALIIDFENKVPHKDTFAFDKRVHKKVTAPAKRTATKSRKKKSTAKK